MLRFSHIYFFLFMATSKAVSKGGRGFEPDPEIFNRPEKHNKNEYKEIFYVFFEVFFCNPFPKKILL